MYIRDVGPVEPWLKYLKEKFFKIVEYTHNDGNHGWGTELKQKMFKSACKHMKTDPYIANTIIGVGMNSIFQSDYVEFRGGLLEAIKADPELLESQKELVNKLELNPYYRIETILTQKRSFPVQFGGERSKEKMWIQLLEIDKWSTDHYATWEVAFNELTWTVRSTNVHAAYGADSDGVIKIDWHFEDILDLRPSDNRSPEYNAACYILGFMYHDLLGGSDELKTKAKWTTILQPK